MQRPTEEVGSDRRRRILKIGGVVLFTSLLVATAAWLLAPKLTEHLLTQQLERVEARTGLMIEAETFQTAGLDGLELRGVAISLPGAEAPLGRIDSIDASADLFQAVRGRPAVTALTIDGVDFTIERQADGTSELDTILDSFRGEATDESADKEEDVSRADDALTARVQRLLRHFGGQYPDVIVRDVVLRFEHAEESEPWPVKRIATEGFTMTEEDGDAPFSVAIDIEAPEDERFQLPNHIEMAGTMRLPVEHSTVHVDFAPELRVVDLPGLPFAQLSVSGIAISDEFTVEITNPTIDSRLRQDTHRLASAERVQAQFNRWTRSPSNLSIVSLEVDGPELYIEHRANGAMNLAEFYEVVRQPSAALAAGTARRLAEELARSAEADADHDEVEEEPQDEVTSPGAFDGLKAQFARLPLRELLTEHLPRKTTLRDLRLVVEDTRVHEQLTRPATHFTISGEILELRHSPLNSLLEGDFQFQTKADNDIGYADIQFEIPYRRGDWNASIEVDSLELAHFSQLAGSRLAEHLHGGEITATVDIQNENADQESITRFNGLLATRQMRVLFGAFAEDPIEVDRASLRFDGYYDPTMPIPSPRLLDVDDEEDEEDDTVGAELQDEEDDTESMPPTQGAFVLDDALARVGDLEATFGFFVYGIDGMRRPNRTGLNVELETTALQTIVDAIPAALRGPLDGTELAGSLAWDFDLEIPLYEASNMVWDAHVDLSPDFEVIYLPEEVDVFKLTEEFEHTIVDEWKQTIAYREREVSYERTVTIPEMRPIPASWLVENTSLDLERIDTIRRRRQWPPVPDYRPELSASELASPEFWLSSYAVDQSAEKPWPPPEESAKPDDDRGSFWDPWGGRGGGGEPEFIDDDKVLPVEEMVYEKEDPLEFHETEIEIDPDRHGTYVYVPLHHISPYLIRAIMTTEDTSFFTHSGFNYLAIRQSVEANLEAGRYVRGASTISMQLAKNLFLDRSRIMSRKLQEVVLVWLMESVADIPKERMIELYLNIIEFGPGIYGIHEASVYYFGKRPDELTISEVAWLVSIVPSPKRFHRYYQAGEINAHWFRRMSRYIRAMKYRERISEEEMEQALDDKPSFYIPEEDEPLLHSDVSEEIDPELEIDDDDELQLDFPGF